MELLTLQNVCLCMFAQPLCGLWFHIFRWQRWVDGFLVLLHSSGIPTADSLLGISITAETNAIPSLRDCGSRRLPASIGDLHCALTAWPVKNHLPQQRLIHTIFLHIQSVYQLLQHAYFLSRVGALFLSFFACCHLHSTCVPLYLLDRKWRSLLPLTPQILWVVQMVPSCSVWHLTS